MKKTRSIFVALMFFLFGMYSCKQTDNDISNKKQTAEVISRKITNLLKITSAADQKLAYKTLDTNEKAIAWKTHLNDVIKSGIYNDAQNELLSELQRNIQATFFNLSNDQFKFRSMEETWLSKAKKIFNSDDLKNIVFSLSIPLNKTTLKIQSIAPDCSCSQESDFCGGTQYCKASSSCVKTDSGCGFLWGHKCDGHCDVEVQT